MTSLERDFPASPGISFESAKKSGPAGEDLRHSSAWFRWISSRVASVDPLLARQAVFSRYDEFEGLPEEGNDHESGLVDGEWRQDQVVRARNEANLEIVWCTFSDVELERGILPAFEEWASGAFMIWNRVHSRVGPKVDI